MIRARRPPPVRRQADVRIDGTVKQRKLRLLHLEVLRRRELRHCLEVQLLVGGLLFDKGKDQVHPHPDRSLPVAVLVVVRVPVLGILLRVAMDLGRRKHLVRALVVGYPQADLLQVVAAPEVSRRLPGRLHRRQQKCDQDTDDRDHHQQLYQGEAPAEPALARVASRAHRFLPPFRGRQQDPGDRSPRETRATAWISTENRVRCLLPPSPRPSARTYPA